MGFVSCSCLSCVPLSFHVQLFPILLISLRCFWLATPPCYLLILLFFICIDFVHYRHLLWSELDPETSRTHFPSFPTILNIYTIVQLLWLKKTIKIKKPFQILSINPVFSKYLIKLHYYISLQIMYLSLVTLFSLFVFIPLFSSCCLSVVVCCRCSLFLSQVPCDVA